MKSKTGLTFAEALLLKSAGERLPNEVYMVGNLKKNEKRRLWTDIFPIVTAEHRLH